MANNPCIPVYTYCILHVYVSVHRIYILALETCSWLHPASNAAETPSPDNVVIGLIPALQEIVAWWEGRKATLEQANDASRETERTTFHVERRWIEAIRRQADLDQPDHHPGRQ